MATERHAVLSNSPIKCPSASKRRVTSLCRALFLCLASCQMVVGQSHPHISDAGNESSAKLAAQAGDHFFLDIPAKTNPLQNWDEAVTRITCTLARLYRTGALHADTYTALFALRTEAAELCTRAEHFAATGDPRAAQAEWEARAAVRELEHVMGGIE